MGACSTGTKICFIARAIKTMCVGSEMDRQTKGIEQRSEAGGSVEKTGNDRNWNLGPQVVKMEKKKELDPSVKSKTLKLLFKKYKNISVI